MFKFMSALVIMAMIATASLSVVLPTNASAYGSDGGSEGGGNGDESGDGDSGSSGGDDSSDGAGDFIKRLRLLINS